MICDIYLCKICFLSYLYLLLVYIHINLYLKKELCESLIYRLFCIYVFIFTCIFTVVNNLKLLFQKCAIKTWYIMFTYVPMYTMKMIYKHFCNILRLLKWGHWIGHVTLIQSAPPTHRMMFGASLCPTTEFFTWPCCHLFTLYTADYCNFMS